jgi:hypothetical protein
MYPGLRRVSRRALWTPCCRLLIIQASREIARFIVTSTNQGTLRPGILSCRFVTEAMALLNSRAAAIEPYPAIVLQPEDGGSIRA